MENYINVALRLHEADPEAKIIITGTKLEGKLCQKLFEATSEFAINTAGKCTLEQTAALVEKADLMICSNTGILHVSACVGTITIGLHGPTNPAKWGAYNRKAITIQSDKFCSPCLYLGHDYGCSTPTCMLHITPDEVFMALRKALNPELFERVLTN